MELKVGMKFIIRGVLGVNEITDIQMPDIYYSNAYGPQGVILRSAFIANVMSHSIDLLDNLVTKTEAPIDEPLHKFCNKHEFVNVGFYTQTFACKHCGCDRDVPKQGRVLSLSDLLPNQQVRFIYERNKFVPPGTIITVRKWQDSWLLFDVPGDSTSMALHQDEDSSEYLEYIE